MAAASLDHATVSLVASLSAALFVALAVWALRAAGRERRLRHTLALALSATGLWSGFSGLFPDSPASAAFLETFRNACWLAYLWMLAGSFGRENFARPVRLIYKVVAAILACVASLQLLDATGVVGGPLLQSLYANLSLIVAAAMLVLMHNLYGIVVQNKNSGFGAKFAALTALWAYDFNLYTIGIIAGLPAAKLIALRPALSILLVPLFAVGWLHKGDRTRFAVSRRMAFQSLSLFAIAAYLGIMAIIANVVRSSGGDYGSLAQQAVLVGGLAALLLLAPSRGFRAWFKVNILKNFYRQRYDYRSEWMRFAQTIGRSHADGEPLPTRVIKAIADITGSPGGLLLLPDEQMTLVHASGWNWDDFDAGALRVPTRTALHVEESGYIVEFDAIRTLPPGADERAIFPAWMLSNDAVWIGVPLMHFGRLAGLVLLKQPKPARSLDWEDFDLLKAVARQCASYLSEAQGQDALAEARRFDEFNRRFAFIMHDIKNAVSQLSLLARNAERHADKPEFRRDMVETLNISVGRMNTLLARLSQHNKGKQMDPARLSLRGVVDAVVAQKQGLHPIAVTGEGDLDAFADSARVEQIIGHLVQNAIDASDPAEPVRIILRGVDRRVAIDVVDRGEGMSADFVRNDLFKAFASTKAGGFGIGAFEARALAISLNGQIEVESEAGKGSRFTLWLPKAQAQAPGATAPQRNDRNVA
ncbi:MAG: PEP-CTERM system histidine kinase PrsK [Sphingomonadales bacterium]|nr:PEP-CTERM system histidine kinase PrsK [Sphingomonadales bacterium]